MTIIRKLRKDDALHDLIALSRQFFEEYAVYHDEFFMIDQLDDSAVVDYFAHFLDTEDTAAFIAVVDGIIVGYITVAIRSQPDYWKIKTVGAISGLMVREDYRRQGIGSQLMREATAFFEAKKVRYFTVFTATRNQPALEFYAQNGMTPLQVTLVNKVGDRTELREMRDDAI